MKLVTGNLLHHLNLTINSKSLVSAKCAEMLYFKSFLKIYADVTVVAPFI